MKFIKLKLSIVLLFSIFLNLSCSKQEAPSINDSILGGREEMGRVEACTRVNFNNNVLLHENTIDLFRCTRWDKDFPALFNAIAVVEAGHWNHVFAPFDKEFISNHSRRDRFFREIKRLDQKNALDDLSKVINALNETNFFDSLNLMFACIDMPSDERCVSRTGRIPDRDDLKNVFKLLNIDSEAINLFSNVLRDLSNSAKDNEQPLRMEINKFKEDHLFTRARVLFVDAFAKKIQDGITTTDRKFVTGFFNTLNKVDELPWLYKWLQDKKMTDKIFSQFLEYPNLTNPLLIKELKALKSFYDKSFMCTIRDNQRVNELIDFDFKTYTGNLVEVIKEDSYKSFYDFSSNTIIGLKVANEICQELSVNEFDVSFSKALEKMALFLVEKKYYDLIKFVFNISPNGKNPNHDFSENQYFLDIMTGETFRTFNEVNGSIVNKTRFFYPEMYKIIKNLPSENYEEIAVFVDELMQGKHERLRTGLAAFWNFFSIAEKNFLFNFIDRHFDENTKSTDLFLFYVSLLNEFEGVAPHLRESYIGDENKLEMTYLSAEQLALRLKGRDVLDEFKRFFSRDHILLLLQTISNGAKINENANAELRYRKSDEFLIKSKYQKYYFEINENEEHFDSKELLNCIAVFNNSSMSLYYLIQAFPQDCVSVAQENISFKLFSWLTEIEQTYRDTFREAGHSLLDDQGILSPMMLNSNLAMAKELDLSLGGLGSGVPSNTGFEYLLNTFKTHLFDYELNKLIPDILQETNYLWTILQDDGVVYRNSVLKEFAKDESFAQSNDFFNDSSLLAGTYGSWVKLGSLESYKKRRILKTQYSAEFSCTSVMNTFIYKNSCPDKEQVKKSLGTIFRYLTTTYEKNAKSGIYYLIEAAKTGGGIKIPLNNKNQKTYRLTLGETFSYLYNTTDKSLAINQLKGSYVNEKWINRTFPLTTLERIEIVIRDVKFKNNYLGAGFLNGVVEATDYDAEVEYRRKLMSKCLKIPKVRCMRAMTKDELRQAENALRHFNSLLDVNNGRGLNKDFKYGNYLKTFEQTLVMSSAKAAQEVKLTPLKDEVLLEHNGRLLGEMTMISLWSNSARIIRDRLGRTRADFDEFMSGDMQRIDDAFLRGFNVEGAGQSAERLIRKLITAKDGKPAILDQVIDWAATLNYDESRVAEEVLGRFTLMSTYLGSPQDVFNIDSKEINEKFKKFQSNNLYELFLSLEKTIDHYEKITVAFPDSFRLYDALVPINNFLIFFNEQLKSTSSPDENIAYRVLNNSFKIINFLFFSPQVDPRFDRVPREVKGVDLAYDFLNNTKNLPSIYHLLKRSKNYLNYWHRSAGDSFLELEQNLGRIVNNKKISFVHLRDYLGFTTKNLICLTGSEVCTPNTHFDEPMKISKYLLIQDNNQRTYFEKATKAIFVENFDQLNKAINELLPAITVRPHPFYPEVY